MYNERQPELVGAVLDTSVIVSGFRSKRGASAEILRMWREKRNFQQGVQIVGPRDFLKVIRSGDE